MDLFIILSLLLRANLKVLAHGKEVGNHDLISGFFAVGVMNVSTVGGGGGSMHSNEAA